MISEGSWATEELSNDFWKFSFAITGINYTLKYIKIYKIVESNIFKIEVTFHHIFDFTVFDQIHAALVSIRDWQMTRSLI